MTWTSRNQVLGMVAVTGLQQEAEALKFSAAKLRPRFRAALATMPMQLVFDRCREHGVPCGKILTDLEDVLADPQILHNGTVETRRDPQMGADFRQARPPARFAGTPSAIRGPAPVMGADTDDVLRELAGYDEAELQALRESGALGG